MDRPSQLRAIVAVGGPKWRQVGDGAYSFLLCQVGHWLQLVSKLLTGISVSGHQVHGCFGKVCTCMPHRGLKKPRK